MTDLLLGCGAGTLGDDPAPEARRAVLGQVTVKLNGADPMTCAQVRNELVSCYKVPANEVDAAIRARNGDQFAPKNLAGSSLALSDPEPWPEPVDGAELLAELARTLARFLALPMGGATVIALWVLHAHAHTAFVVSAILAFLSALRGCGKTTALTVLSALCPRPLFASNVTAATVFRAVEAFHPSLLVDELDTQLDDREDLRGILNSGHFKAGATVMRTAGDDHEVRTFSTWCPKALAKIGHLPPTLADRSIIITMRRRRPDERTEPVRLDRLHRELELLKRKAARWAADHLDALRWADPEVPAGLTDRQADNARPLLAIADAAGGEWPERARRALVLLTSRDPDEEEANVLVLADLRELFEVRGTDRLASADIIKALTDRDDRPWGEWQRGQPLTERGLARLLRPFDVRPRPLWINGRTVRGYLLETLENPFTRYLPPAQVQGPQESSKDAKNSGFTKCKVGPSLADTKQPENPSGRPTLADLTDTQGGPRAEQVVLEV